MEAVNKPRKTVNKNMSLNCSVYGKRYEVQYRGMRSNTEVWDANTEVWDANTEVWDANTEVWGANTEV